MHLDLRPASGNTGSLALYTSLPTTSGGGDTCQMYIDHCPLYPGRGSYTHVSRSFARYIVHQDRGPLVLCTLVNNTYRWKGDLLTFIDRSMINTYRRVYLLPLVHRSLLYSSGDGISILTDVQRSLPNSSGDGLLPYKCTKIFAQYIRGWALALQMYISLPNTSLDKISCVTDVNRSLTNTPMGSRISRDRVLTCSIQNIFANK